jgi:hypothetical protein
MSARASTRRRELTIVDAMRDANLLGAGLGDAVSWSTWLLVLRAAFALPMSPDERDIFRAVAGDRDLPTQRVKELWCIAGRRSGKTRIAAAISVFVAALEQHRLASGEMGHVLLLAASRSQAGVAYGYVLGFLESSAILRQQIVSTTANEVRLKGNIVIGVHAGSYRTVRGRTLLAVVGDETSFWRDESSASPDVEVYRACAPALAASGGVWVGISTPYRKLGLLYQRWRDHFAQSGDDVLVVQGSSRTFNGTLDPAVIERAKASDPEAGESEWEGGFRSDIAAFLSDESIEDAIDHARPLELPPRSGPRSGLRYFGLCDPSGGRHDAFTLCIAHKEQGRFIADLIRGATPPFDPRVVVNEHAAVLKEYGLRRVRADNYSAGWAETAFRDAGIAYERSELAKSQLYLEVLPLFMRGVISIPNHARLIRELRLLERRATRIGRDLVDHGRNGSDDFSNVLAGALHGLAAERFDDLSWVR